MISFFKKHKSSGCCGGGSELTNERVAVKGDANAGATPEDETDSTKTVGESARCCSTDAKVSVDRAPKAQQSRCCG